MQCHFILNTLQSLARPCCCAIEGTILRSGKVSKEEPPDFVGRFLMDGWRARLPPVLAPRPDSPFSLLSLLGGPLPKSRNLPPPQSLILYYLIPYRGNSNNFGQLVPPAEHVTWPEVGLVQWAFVGSVCAGRDCLIARHEENAVAELRRQ